MKRDLSTRKLAYMLHTTVEEVRSARADEKAEKEDLDAKTAHTSATKSDDSNARYCRQNGKRYCWTIQNQEICMYKGKCLFQVQNSSNAKKCSYKEK
ncbi:hypothetical protein GF343_04745 [Candidatus Woesearchaeota archaeon]|nr:hypothetical protein [Candidatus Woesearchaeota archaeon]